MWTECRNWLLNSVLPAATTNFLRFEKRSFAGDGACENTFGPRGLSGGALLDSGDFTSAESYARDPAGSALLAGMVIEYHREYHALVSVRIDTVINGIRRILARRRHTPCLLDTRQ